jgi:hypothetical protein
MKRKHKIILKIFSALLTLAAFYLITSSIYFLDLVTSLMPGWHTTINVFSQGVLISVVAVMSILLSYLLFRLIYSALFYIILKIPNNN